MSRAGWSAAKFILVNTCRSSSTSGPSARVNPMRVKMSMISFLTMVNGCLVPNFTGYGVRVRSMSSSWASFCSHISLKALMRSRAVCFSSLTLMPTSFFCSAGTFLKSAINELMAPFLLKYFNLSASISSGVEALSPLTSSRSFSIFSSIMLWIFLMPIKNIDAKVIFLD